MGFFGLFSLRLGAKKSWRVSHSRLSDEELLVESVEADVEEPSGRGRKFRGRRPDRRGRNVQDHEGVVERVSGRLFGPPEERSDLQEANRMKVLAPKSLN